jgi:predicted metal-dependent hydrolase
MLTYQTSQTSQPGLRSKHRPGAESAALPVAMPGVVPLKLDFSGPDAAVVAPAIPAAPAAKSLAPAPLPLPLPLATDAPASYLHPRAARELLLGGQRVAYALKRSARRSIGFSVGAEGLAVSAPKWVTLAEIDQAVQRKESWILRKLQQTLARHQHLEAARMDWRDGAVLPFRGELLTLVLAPPPESTALHRDALLGTNSLRLALAPGSATALQIEKAVQAWLMQQARAVFTERLDHFAPQLGVQWRQLSLSSAATRWGTARANGDIRLNWRLLHFSPAVLDYVVVHELSHLRVMDHSPRFWATVQSVIPDHAALRRQLKEQVIARW